MGKWHASLTHDVLNSSETALVFDIPDRRDIDARSEEADNKPPDAKLLYLRTQAVEQCQERKLDAPEC